MNYTGECAVEFVRAGSGAGERDHSRPQSIYLPIRFIRASFFVNSRAGWTLFVQIIGAKMVEDIKKKEDRIAS